MLRYITDTHVAWRCEACLTCHVHPHSHARLHSALGGGYEDTMSLVCPTCGTTESMRHNFEETPAHPDILVGMELPGGNVVSAHHIAGISEWHMATQHLRTAMALRDRLLKQN